jgi:hypothetical protein
MVWTSNPRMVANVMTIDLTNQHFYVGSNTCPPRLVETKNTDYVHYQAL